MVQPPAPTCPTNVLQPLPEALLHKPPVGASGDHGKSPKRHVVPADKLLAAFGGIGAKTDEPWSSVLLV